MPETETTTNFDGMTRHLLEEIRKEQKQTNALLLKIHQFITEEAKKR